MFATTMTSLHHHSNCHNYFNNPPHAACMHTLIKTRKDKSLEHTDYHSQFGPWLVGCVHAYSTCKITVARLLVHVLGTCSLASNPGLTRRFLAAWKAWVRGYMQLA